jgi:F-type H+-transporting ATPase subunit a
MTPDAAGPLELGALHTTDVAGFTLHLDTIVATITAGVLVIAAGLYARRGASSGRPTRAQLAWETVISAAERYVGSRIGPAGRRVVPLAVTLFVFILAATLLETVPSGHPDKVLPAPTGDLNLTLALALLVVVLVHVSAIRARGLGGYLRHYLKPTPFLLPLRILEEATKPVTLALRLFGNVFAGSVMVILIFELIPPVFAPVPLVAWKLFSVFVAVMQAFLFSLLTILYFETAIGSDRAPADSIRPEASMSRGGLR